MGLRSAAARVLIKSAQALSLTDAKASRIWNRVLGSGGETDAGETITVDVALQLATVWACVRLIAETVATLPLVLYQSEGDEREPARDHPLFDLLARSPNGDHTAVEFWEGLTFSMLLWGNAYAEKMRIGGRVVALTPLRADMMKVERDANGALVYRFSDLAGHRRELSESDVLHVRAFGNGGDVGLSPITYGRQTFGAARATDKAAAKTFANGVRPSGVLTMATGLRPEQRQDVRDNIIAPFAGVMNAGGVFLLEHGMAFSPVTMKPEDAQMLETRAFHVEEICRWFGVPPILVGHAAAGQTMWGSGVEQIMLGWLVLGLRNILKRIEQSVGRSLILPHERGALYPEFNIEGLLRADSKTRAELLAAQVQNGILNRNEARKLENRPPYDGGEVFTAQTNLAPVATLGSAVATKAGLVDRLFDGGGPTGHAPFDETKAFDASKHPRDKDGRWIGRGGRGGRAVRLALRAIADRRHNDDVELGRVPGARFTEVAGRDVDGWRFELTSEGARHGDNAHGPKSGDRNPISPRDFKRLPTILNKGKVGGTGGRTKSENLRTVTVDHHVGGETFHAVLTVRKRTRTLRLHSFSKLGR